MSEFLNLGEVVYCPTMCIAHDDEPETKMSIMNFMAEKNNNLTIIMKIGMH